MKYTYGFFALSLLFSIPAFSEVQQLEAEILQSVDGIFMDGPTIAAIKKYQMDSRTILFGKRQEDGTRQGTYIFEGNPFSVIQLCEIESQGRISKGETTRLLGEMREDFERVAAPFRDIARNFRSVMAELIYESNRKRKRTDSVLNRWANPHAKDERALLDEHVKTIKDFETFVVDLYNFLEDLVHSCPKGIKLYEEWKTEQLKKARDKNA